MKLIISLCLCASVFNLSASVPMRWTVETSRLAPAVFDVVRGETIALEAAFNASGKPFSMDGEPVSIFWQTNGMGNAWWTAPAVATSNLVRATFTPEMDPGAATVNGFLGSSGSIYRAAFTFRFRHGPGAVPNTLPLPVPVIDFAKVTVLNPPWSGGGGGGGVNTNAVRDIIGEYLATNGIRSVDGEGRYLPPYLHYKEMDDTYPDAAAEWYAQADYSHGSCSARRTGNLLERNYDWNFNFMPEYVVRIPSSTGRFASLAVCNVGTKLTEADVVSGKHLRWLKALPGHAVDGINSEGVVAEVNVVSTNGVENWHGDPATDGIHCLGAIRWVLDHATNAQHGAEVLAAKVYVPAGYGNFHYMIADATSTWIVENGEAHLVPSSLLDGAVLTNFRLYPTRDTSGEGQERYDALAFGANITSQWWTLTYTAAGYRASDLPGLDTNLLFRAWASKPKEAHRGETFDGQSWWQTVHTSVYDITNRTLRICVQEIDDWYTFAIPSAGGVKPEAVREIVEPMVAAATNGLRRVDDLAVYTKTNLWTFSGPPELTAVVAKYKLVPRLDIYYGDRYWFLGSATGQDNIYFENAINPPDENNITFNAVYWDTYDPVGSIVAHAALTNVFTDRLATTNGVNAAIAENDAIGTSREIVRGRNYGQGGYYISVEFASRANYAKNADFAESDYDGNNIVATYAKKTELSAAISTNNPAFVSAVRAIMPTKLRAYDPVRQCWWNIQPVNGVLTLIVED